MSIYVIGRSKDDAAIVLTSKLGRVSRRHAQLSVGGDGVIELADLQSANGTEVYKEGGWRKIAKAQVHPGDRLRFGGEVEITVADLLSQANQRTPSAPPRMGLGSDPRPPPLAPLGGFPANPPPRPQPVRQPNSGQAPTGRPSARPSGESASANCPNCQSPASGQFCASCGTKLPERRSTGIFKVVAQDILQWGEQRSLFDIIVNLVAAPVRTSLGLSQNPSFQGHGALLIAGLGLGVIYNKLTAAYKPMHGLWEEIKKNHGVAEFLATLIEPQDAILLITYTFFLFSFIVSYLVFRDYSSQSHPPRAYLKLCCFSFFLNTVLTGIVLGVAPVVKWLQISPRFAPLLIIVTILSAIGASLYYGFQTHMQFWQISGVRTFRGTLITILLTVFLTILIYLGIVVLIVAGITIFDKH